MLYLAHRAPELKSGENIKHELGEIFFAYQGRPLSALADVTKAIQLRHTGRDGRKLAPATIKNRISYLRAACRWAWKHHNMGESDPGARVTVPTVNNERHVYLSREQMLRVARACTHRPTRAIIRMAFYTGMRLSEIERATVEGDCFYLGTTKNGDKRLVPIHPRIRALPGKYPAQSRYITSYHWRKACKAVGLEGTHAHDLRHSAASAMINADVDLYTVGAVLGHRSAASTKRYSHLATAKLAQAVGKIGKRA